MCIRDRPYFVHPINVALILAQLGMDEETIVGGLLHDVVEDTEYTREQLVEDFSEEIALLVDGVTKLGTIKFESKEELQAENFRKMFLACLLYTSSAQMHWTSLLLPVRSVLL